MMGGMLRSYARSSHSPTPRWASARRSGPDTQVRLPAHRVDVDRTGIARACCELHPELIQWGGCIRWHRHADLVPGVGLERANRAPGAGPGPAAAGALQHERLNRAQTAAAWHPDAKGHA